MTKLRIKNPAIEKALKFTVDLSIAVKDELIEPKEFADYIKTNMKLNGKKGNLGESITVSISDNKLNLVSKFALSKRYLKYLTKKYLKKNDILEYFRVIATDKSTYKIKYVKLEQNEEEAADK